MNRRTETTLSRLLPLAAAALCAGCSLSMKIEPVANVPDNVGASPQLADHPWRTIAILPPTVSQRRSIETAFVPLQGYKPLYTYLTTAEDMEVLSRLEPALVNKGYSLVERTHLQRILQERDLTAAGVVGDAHTLRQLGLLLSADAILFVEVQAMYNAWMYKWDGRGGYVGAPLGAVSLSVRAVDVQSGTVLWTCGISRTALGLLKKPIVVSNRDVLSKGLYSAGIPGLGKVIDQAVSDLVGYFPIPRGSSP